MFNIATWWYREATATKPTTQLHLGFIKQVRSLSGFGGKFKRRLILSEWERRWLERWLGRRGRGQIPAPRRSTGHRQSFSVFSHTHKNSLNILSFSVLFVWDRFQVGAEFTFLWPLSPEPSGYRCPPLHCEIQGKLTVHGQLVVNHHAWTPGKVSFT